MNRKLITFIAVIALSMPAAKTFADSDNTTATTQPDQKEKRGEALERFKSALEQLDLTAEQKEKIKSIMTEARSKLEALKGQADAREQAKPILQKVRQDIAAVLTPEQKAKLREILKNDRTQSKT